MSFDNSKTADLESPDIESRWQKVMQLRALLAGESRETVGVDREADCIRGMILAQEGPFKSEGRGEFDRQALETIVRLTAATPNGLKSRFTHPDVLNDGLGKFLGRVRNPRLDTITARDSEGRLKTNPVQVVRGDLYLDPSSHDTPSGDLGKYVLDLAESDPDAMSSSLVLEADQEYRTDRNGRPMLDADGNRLPPLWRPTSLHAVDCVDTGDAVDGLLAKQLSADGLPDAVVRQAAVLMDRQFAGKDRIFVENRCTAWLARYLDRRYAAMGDDSGPTKPDGAEVPVEVPADKSDPLHNGCRSTLAYHHLTQCRKCGGVISSCGCDHREKESRVITMAKEPCAKCMEAADKPPDLPPDNPKSPADDLPPVDGPDAPAEYSSARDPASRLRTVTILDLS